MKNGGDAGPEGSPPDFLHAWWALLRRRWRWGAASFVVVTALAAAVVLLARPVYRAEARLRLGEPPPMSGVSPTAGVVSFLRLGGDPFANDVELMSSRTLAERLVLSVALSARLEAPRGYVRDSLVTSIQVDEGTIKGTYDIDWTGSGSVSIRRSAPTDSLVGEFAVGAVAAFDGVRIVFKERSALGPASIRLRTTALGDAIRGVSGRLELVRTRREANVLGIRYVDSDPRVAREAVEATVRNFRAMRTDLMERESGETVDSLRTVSRGTEAELLEAEDGIERLQRESGLVVPDAQAEALIGRFEGAFTLLEVARTELEALDYQLGRAEAAENRVEAWTTLVAHPRFLESQTVGDLLSRLTLLEASRVQLMMRRTDEAREVRAVETQIEQLDGALRTIAREFRGSLAQQVDEQERQVAAMRAELLRMPAQVLELGRRQRTARVLAELLIITEQRLRQEELRQALTFSNIQVIDPPKLHHRPIWPRKKLGLAVGLLLAGGSALLTAVVVERADGSVHTAAELRAATGVPVLAVISGPGLGRPSASDVAAILSVCSDKRVTLATVDDGVEVEVLARGLREADVLDSVGTLRLDGYGAAVAAGASGGSVVMLVRARRTQERALHTAAGLLGDAGGALAGTILVVNTDREADAAWG